MSFIIWTLKLWKMKLYYEVIFILLETQTEIKITQYISEGGICLEYNFSFTRCLWHHLLFPLWIILIKYGWQGGWGFWCSIFEGFQKKNEFFFNLWNEDLDSKGHAVKISYLSDCNKFKKSLLSIISYGWQTRYL